MLSFAVAHPVLRGWAIVTPSAKGTFESSRKRVIPVVVSRGGARITMSQESTPNESDGFENYDRDYYDELKAQYAGVEGVRIYSKDDYEIDDLTVPWLSENRARDLDKIRKDVKERPTHREELSQVSEKPMQWEDMHTGTEMEDFEPLFRDADSVSGRSWEDPMPESDFERDPKWIDLRKIEDHVMEEAQKDLENELQGLSSTPRKWPHRYASEEHEFRELEDSFDRMRAEHLYDPFVKSGYAENVPSPDPQEFAKWQRAAEERGGNATQDESYFLSPFRNPFPDSELPPNSDPKVNELQHPKQHQALVDAHCGDWEGSVSVFSLVSGRKLYPVRQEYGAARSRVAIREDGLLSWTTIAATSSSEIVSGREFSSPKFEDALVPGRGVSMDGNYVSIESLDKDSDLSPGQGFSVSANAIRAVTKDNRCKAVLEIGLVTSDHEGSTRHRVLLCTNSETSATAENKKAGRSVFSTVVVFSEYSLDHVNVLEARKRCANGFESGVKIASTSLLMGSWKGEGILLHPAFPPMSCRPVESTFCSERRKNILDTEVTWVDYTMPERAGQESKRRVRTLGKKKMSKRVAAAKAHDQRRLAACSILTRERAGSEAEEEVFAWRAEPSEAEFSYLYSPRTGRFVCDYGGALVTDNLLLTFPLGSALPSSWNSITLTELCTPSRTKISAGRNEYGDLVGVLFVTESLHEGEACDTVASYV